MQKALSGSEQVDFICLVQNGIDFLERAYEQLETDPKHSVINFYTAVELLLKAPLVLNHWSLIIADREPNIKKFKSGDFRSIGFEDTCSRLDAILERPLSISGKAAFDKVRKHRNKMVHFFHGGLSTADIDDIREEQAEAWFELNRFLTKTHKEIFATYLQGIKWMERKLRLNDHYAKIIFKNLQPEISAGKKNGRVFKVCPNCNMESYEHLKLHPQVPDLNNYKCLVCLHEDVDLRIDCPSCSSKSQHLKSNSAFNCSACQYKAEERDIYGLLDDSNHGPDNYFEAITPANCDECGSYKSICEFRGGYICCCCLTFFDALYCCEYCNDYGTNLREDSYWSGCLHCEGSAGRHADD